MPIGTALHVLDLWYEEYPHVANMDVILGTGQTEGCEPFADEL